MIRNHTLSFLFNINDATPRLMVQAPEQAKEREGGIYMQHICVTFSTSDFTLQENGSLVIAWLSLFHLLKERFQFLVLYLQYFTYLSRVRQIAASFISVCSIQQLLAMVVAWF